ncbi:MAG: Tryptophan synthase alpha chain [Lentisphaerae bacterium ADurb.Bin242]|nr:MAG: Tryptophan synthase alpha chain [Lentisphaerae bacterium ADurb.Bin242]
MDKLQKIFAKCKTENRAALILFVECGCPDLASSEKLIERVIEAGADIVELGIPFSDPMADGTVIQHASQQALSAGATLSGILEMVRRVSARHPETGFILFSYLNVMLNHGLEKLCVELEAMKADGILAVDMPVEERAELDIPCRKHHLHRIPLVAPTTPAARIKKIVSGSTGFVYCVSRPGVTGIRHELPEGLEEYVRTVRKLSPVPVAVGFGIADGKTARSIGRIADGVVVGSAVVTLTLGELPPEQKIDNAAKLVAELAESLKDGRIA